MKLWNPHCQRSVRPCRCQSENVEYRPERSRCLWKMSNAALDVIISHWEAVVCLVTFGITCKIPQMTMWTLIAVLPNLPIDKSWELEFFAFAHPADPRLEAICRSSIAAQALLKNFKHPFKRGCRPCAFLMADNCPKRFRSWEAMTDLRNAFAIAAVLHGWKHAVGSANIWFPQYSDYFDFYPLYPSPDGTGLICNGYALNSYDNAAAFEGQPYPDLPGPHGSFRVGVDKSLLNLLTAEWKAKYTISPSSWRQIAIFRSLSIAYRASGIPKGCEQLVFDIGIQLSLWVSAHECLVHPGPNGHAGVNQVLALLGKMQWRRHALSVRRRHVLRNDKLTKPMTYVQHLYRRLNDARNNFLHGNPVGAKNAFLGPVSRELLSIQVAPLIYCAALEAMLTVRQPRKKRTTEEIVVAVFRYNPLENALLITREKRKKY